MKALILIKLYVFLFSFSLFAQYISNEPNSIENKIGKPLSAFEQIDMLIVEIENGKQIDVNQVNDLIQPIFNMAENQPMGYVMLDNFIKGLISKYPNAIYKIIRKGIYNADRFIFQLGEVGGEQNVDFLIEYLDERLQRINKLIEQGEKEDTEEWRFNRAAVMALARTKNKKGLPILHQALKSGFINISSTAMDELARAGDESLIPEISNWLSSDNKSKISVALRAIALLSNEQLKPELMANLKEPLAKIFSEVKNSKDDSLAYRYTINALASIGDDSILSILHEMVQDESEYIKEVEELKHWPDPWKGRHEPWNYSQNEILDAIAKLGSPKSLVVLDKLMTEAQDPNIRSKARKIAEQIKNQKK